jgi:tetratricopeptide (TPR) repeat protein
VAAAAAGATAFFGGGLVDWLWQFPALGLLGFLLLGVAVACRDAPLEGRPPRRRHAGLLRAGALLAGLALAVSFALPGISARFTNAAYGVSATDPALALSRLSRAADYDPLSASPLLARSIILRRVSDFAGSRAALDEAASREPHNWFVYLERAMLFSQQRAWPAAQRDVATAARLNPRQEIVPLVVRAIARHRPVAADHVEAALAAQLATKLGQTG